MISIPLCSTIADASVGKTFNNQSRILESRTTRTGIPYGPGGTVTPPASFFVNQPPNIGRSDYMKTDGKGQSRVGSVDSGSSERTAVGGVMGVKGLAAAVSGGASPTTGRKSAHPATGRKRKEISG